jgi:hypothetical protein
LPGSARLAQPHGELIGQDRGPQITRFVHRGDVLPGYGESKFPVRVLQHDRCLDRPEGQGPLLTTEIGTPRRCRDSIGRIISFVSSSRRLIQLVLHS